MIALQLTLILLVISTNAVSIGNVSEQNVTKREANLGDLFPDWVPFKNKHGEELGEFVQVKKSKPKKRLAPPVNFILRAVAEPEGDDYFEKGQGESDSDDYYEKKEWSDTNRPAQYIESPKTFNHTEISEIDGVVNIITRRRPNPVVEALKKAKQREDAEDIREKEDRLPPVIKETSDQQKTVAKKRHEHRYEDDIDYEESNAEKLKPETAEEDQSEQEAKKTSILDSVDELKERHAKEQVAISEKVKEEEIYKEEHEREKIQAQLSIDESDKYDDKTKAKKGFLDYEDYENKESSLEEKYKMTPERTTTSTTTRFPKRTNKYKGKKDKTVESGKLSVFKNPQLYIVYDDSEETTTVKSRARPPKTKTSKNEKFSAKYTSTPSILDDAERISLVPEESDGKEGEPTLFFPKKRKGNKKRKSKSSTASDSSAEETGDDKKTKYTAILTDTTGSDTIVVDTTAEGGPTGSDHAQSNTNGVTDAVPASTHHKEDKKAEDYHREKGK